MIFILVIGLFQLSVALLLIFTLGKLKNSEKYIALFFTFGLMHFLLKFYFFSIAKNDFLFNNLVTCFVLGYGPAIYNYIRKYYNISSSINNKIHWVPLLTASLAYLFIFIAVLLFNIYDFIEAIETYKSIMVLSFSLSVVFYGIKSSVMVYKNRTLYKGFEWERLFVIGLILAVPTFFISSLSYLNVYTNESIGRIFIYTSLILISIFLIQHLYMINKKEEWIKQRKKSKGKYYNSSIKQSDLERIAKELNTYMINEEPWLDEQLTLDKLAAHIGMSKHHITQVCNNYFDKNFYQYVNEFRVLKAQEMIKNSKDKLSLIEIAYDCGFSSKSSFNRYFKLFTNQTPSSFRKLNKASQAQLQ